MEFCCEEASDTCPPWRPSFPASVYCSFLPIKGVFTYTAFTVFAFASVPSVTPGFTPFLSSASVLYKLWLTKCTLREFPSENTWPGVGRELWWWWIGFLEKTWLREKSDQVIQGKTITQARPVPTNTGNEADIWGCTGSHYVSWVQHAPGTVPESNPISTILFFCIFLAYQKRS